MPNVLAMFRDKDGILKGIVVGDALYCGVCKPKEDPIEMEWLD
jgi:hypothetical protein